MANKSVAQAVDAGATLVFIEPRAASYLAQHVAQQSALQAQSPPLLQAQFNSSQTQLSQTQTAQQSHGDLGSGADIAPTKNGAAMKPPRIAADPRIFFIMETTPELR
jgi:hypothetical protein